MCIHPVNRCAVCYPREIDHEVNHVLPWVNPRFLFCVAPHCMVHTKRCVLLVLTFLGEDLSVRLRLIHVLLVTVRGGAGPHLVVAPVATLENWIREFEMWCRFFCLFRLPHVICI